MSEEDRWRREGARGQAETLFRQEEPADGRGIETKRLGKRVEKVACLDDILVSLD